MVHTYVWIHVLIRVATITVVCMFGVRTHVATITLATCVLFEALNPSILICLDVESDCDFRNRTAKRNKHSFAVKNHFKFYLPKTAE